MKANMSGDDSAHLNPSPVKDVAALPPRVRCEFTGAMIFAPMPGLAPLTTESVREMLEELEISELREALADSGAGRSKAFVAPDEV